MAESNATQVILTDDGIKIIHAQSTANNAASQASKADSAALIAQSTANDAKSAADSSYRYANSEMAVQSTAAAKAQSTADNAFSKAQEVGSQAGLEIQNNSTATAKAQSTADSAFSQAVTAIDNGKATSQAVTALKDGSTLTIAELGNGLATKVSNSEYASYKEQTASQIGQMVSNGDFNTYKTQTANLIAEKVATKDFTAYQDTTAKSIDSKVESKDFNTYKTQTADLIDDKVSNSAYASDKTQTASEIAQMVSNSAFSTYQEQTASQIASKVDNGDFLTYKNQTTDLISSKVATKDFNTYTSQTATAISSKVESKDFNTYKEQTAGMISSKVSNGDFATYKTQTANDINLRVATKDLIDQINLQAGNTLISSSGQLTLAADTIYFDTNKPVIIPSANITGTLNGKTITGSTINGTTFNGGDRINNANNTAGYYPMTITSDGAYKSTYFDSAVGLQSSVESGAISYKYRSMIGSGTYSYNDVAIDGQGIALGSGTTTTKDATFNAPETEDAYISLTTKAGLYLHGSNANIDFGGHLDDDPTSVGMYMNPYGNIVAKSASHYWQISVAGDGNTGGGAVARFGIDNASAYNIEFNRELDVGNIGINMAHSIISQDGKGLYINSGKGGRADLNVASLNYTGSVSKSLLSEKRDVKKVNTAYWAQLVNSIDLATYQYKDDDNTSNLRLSGIVDDVNEDKQWNLPDIFVARDEDGKLSGIENIVLQNAILATIQEQQKEIDQLNGHLLELEAKLNG